jgi:enediyne biosynthesis protein E4
VTTRAGLDIEMYGMGVAVGDYNNDGFPDILITCVGQNRLFRNTGKGTFVDVTTASGLGKARGIQHVGVVVRLRPRRLLDLFVCNYVKWSPEHDVFCSLDGKHKSYCTPEAYRGETCWLFHNRGNGTFEDVTAASGIFDSSSKSLGVAMFDDDRKADGPICWWPMTRSPTNFIATSATAHSKMPRWKLDSPSAAKARPAPAWAWTWPTSITQGTPGVAITNFDNEMIGLYRMSGKSFRRHAPQSGVGMASKTAWASAAFFSMPISMAGSIRCRQRTHRRDRAQHSRQCRICAAAATFSEQRQRERRFRDSSATWLRIWGSFDQPKVGRGLAYADFDRDGDLDLLLTTNNGPAYLYRNDQLAGNHSIRFRLVGTKSNRDGIGATVRVFRRRLHAIANGERADPVTCRSPNFR